MRSQPTQSAHNGSPGLGRCSTVALRAFADQYPNVVPTSEPDSSAVYRGYTPFKTRCLHRHARGEQGGKVGSDLDRPRNVLAYRAAGTVRAFIRDPEESKQSRMPADPHLDDVGLDKLLDCPRHMQARAR